MRKKILIAIIFGLFVGVFACVYSVPAYARSMFISPADNKYDPVDGSLITKNSQFRTAYGNKWYRFNSYDNVKLFKERPEYFVRKLEQMEASPAVRRATVNEREAAAPAGNTRSQRSGTTSSGRRGY